MPPDTRSAPQPAAPPPPDGPATDPALLARLAAVAGLDLAACMCNFNGQLPRLQRVLRRFADTYQHGEPALLQAAAQADPQATWRLCHSLRGACASLCAQNLVQRIVALEATLAQHASLEQRQAQAALLHAELVTLAGALDQALRG